VGTGLAGHSQLIILSRSFLEKLVFQRFEFSFAIRVVELGKRLNVSNRYAAPILGVVADEWEPPKTSALPKAKQHAKKRRSEYH
jgi:hypothetical protein